MEEEVHIRRTVGKVCGPCSMLGGGGRGGQRRRRGVKGVEGEKKGAGRKVKGAGEFK